MDNSTPQSGRSLSKPLLISVGVLVVLLIAGGSYYLYINRPQPPTTMLAQLATTSTPVVTTTPTATQQTPSPTSSKSSAPVAVTIPVAVGNGYIIAETTSTDATFYKIDARANKIKLVTIPFDSQDSATVAATISPNGKTIVYVDRDGNLQSYDIVSGKTTLLKAATRDDANAGKNLAFGTATFSPDGKTLGLKWYGWEVSGIALMNSDGTNFQQFNKGFEGDEIAFSPDSKQFVIAAPTNYFGGDPARLYVADVANPDNGREILPKEIKATGDRPAGTKDVYTPSWSPDGKKIAFGYKYLDTGDPSNEKANQYLDIYAINADGTNFHEVTNNQSYSSDPFWKDNSTIVYGLSKMYSGNQQGIFSIQDNGQNNTSIFSSTAISYRPVSISPDNKRLVYLSGSPQHYADPIRDLSVLNLETKDNKSMGNPTFIGWIK